MRRLAAALLAVTLSGCKTFDAAVEQAAGKAVDKGWITRGQASSIKKSATALRKGAADISDSEEYYIGRAVSAELLSRYKPARDPELNRYVRTLGQAVAMVSDRPATYSGYRFQVLDSDEPNAFAAPGGFILVTRGLIRLARSEDELAAALAHEIAHVSLKHGLQTIKTARLTTAFGILAKEASKGTAAEDLADLTEAFEGAIEDVVKHLVVNGYSREKEYEADSLGAEYLRRAGYDPAALGRLLGRVSGGGGLLKTHPSSSARAERLANATTPEDYRPSKVRDRRFAKALKAG